MAIPGMIAEKLNRLRLIAITDSGVLAWPMLLDIAGRALDAGLPALMLREQILENGPLRPFAEQMRARTQARGALLIVNRRLDLAQSIRADGVHLGKVGPSIAEAKNLLGPDVMIGYSAHSVDEGLRAFQDGAHYVTLSPIFATQTKRNFLPLGLEKLSELVQLAPGPVIALGGVGPGNMSDIMACGAYGVASIRAVFAAKDPGRVTRHLIALIETQDSLGSMSG